MIRYLAILFLVAVAGCNSTSTPHQQAILANANTQAALSSASAYLEVLYPQLEKLTGYVVDAGKPYLESAKTLLAGAAKKTTEAEHANVEQRLRIDDQEVARGTLERKYVALEGKWYVRLGRWIERIVFWLIIGWLALGLIGSFTTGFFGGGWIFGIGKFILQNLPAMGPFCKFGRYLEKRRKK
jgi:hypothetical protein